jgi:hypothetical protein
VIDLMEALRASLERKGAAPAKAQPAKAQAEPVEEADTRKPPKRAPVAEPAPAARARARK